MPRKDGTGPMSAGSMTGRGMGFCTGVNACNYGVALGLGVNFRRGFGRNVNANQISSEIQKELLQEQRNYLQRYLENIDKQLLNL